MNDIAYMGDDLPDIRAIKAVGFGIAVNNASPHLKEHADFETLAQGGNGAVREACEYILSAQNKLQTALQPFIWGLIGSVKHRKLKVSDDTSKT